MSVQTRRKSKRHELDASKQIKVFVIRAENSEELDATDQKHPAQIVDISLNGFKLNSKIAFGFQEKIFIELPRRDGRVVKMSAEVRWVQPNPTGNTWSVGCLIEDSFPDDYIDEIAQDGVLDRRNSQRQKINEQATGRWELSQADQPVKILDVSNQGIGIFMEENAEIGKRIRIKSNDGKAITAKAVWQKAVDNGYMIGCEVIEGSPYSIVQSTVLNARFKGEVSPNNSVLTLCGLSFLLAVIIRSLFFV